MSVALVFITDGRRPYFERCLATIDRLRCDWATTVVVDDSADPAHHDWVADHVDHDVYVRHDRRMGGAQAVRTAWSTVARLDVDHVFHVEEDFTFPVPVDIKPMVDVLEGDDRLAELVLRRQPWGGEGPGGYIGDNPAAFMDRDGWLMHRLGFWLNPCLYPVAVTRVGWPAHGHEMHYTKRLSAAGWHFGVWGSRTDPPRCWHVGSSRHESWTW